jgi:hydrogenase maturation protease
VLVIAVGNSFRGDDGLGLELAARLRALQVPGLTVVEALGDVGLIDAWAGEERVVLVDAVQSGAAPGTVIRLDATTTRLPREWFHLSSHQVGVADAVELARTLHKLPRRLTFIGVEAQRFDEGAPLTTAVAGAIDEAVSLIQAESRVALRRE